jgi:methionyl aminopeptidase
MNNFDWKEEELKLFREAGRRAATILSEMINKLHTGMSARVLDEYAGELMKKLDVQSGPREDGFPGNTCISIYPIVAHGVPTKRIMRCGDLVNIDVAINYKGYYADLAYTLPLGEARPAYERICQAGKKALRNGISECRAGNDIGAIGKAMESAARSDGFTIIKNLCSHGLGKSLHAPPYNIFNYDSDEQEPLELVPGMMLALEPYVSSGACRAKETDNDWNLTTHNNSHVVQFEHTVLVTENGPEILTLL